MTVSDAPLTIYTTSWCAWCIRLKSMLRTAGIKFHEIDIEKDMAASDFVRSVNRGNKTVPTVKFADGSTLTNPDPREVKKKLAELSSG